MSKREEIRSRRQQERRRQQVGILLFIGGVAILLSALLIVPSLIPVSGFIEITPHTRPFEDGRNMGASDAPVVLEVFEDFLCPSCVQFVESTESRLIEDYIQTGLLRYEFKQFPFIDQASFDAAAASECAASQNRFWDYHEILFVNQSGHSSTPFSKRYLVAYAEYLGLDVDRFETCLETNQPQAIINADLLEVQERGISGTPAVFVNGVQITPGFVPSYEDLQQAIEEQLKDS
jgi:protein-disulfide isomerase